MVPRPRVEHGTAPVLDWPLAEAVANRRFGAVAAHSAVRSRLGAEVGRGNRWRVSWV